MHYFEALFFLNRDYESQKTDYFSENFNCGKGENFVKFLRTSMLGIKKNDKININGSISVI